MIRRRRKLTSVVVRTLFKSLMWGFVAFVLVFGASPFFGSLEGQIFPPQRDVQLVTWVPQDDGSILVRFRFYKQRRECLYKDITFYRLAEGDLEYINWRIYFNSPTPLTRPVGWNRGRVLVFENVPNMTKEELMAFIDHQCHWGYLTRSMFYNGSIP